MTNKDRAFGCGMAMAILAFLLENFSATIAAALYFISFVSFVSYFFFKDEKE